MLEQNATRKKQVNKLLELEIELDIRKDKEYKVEVTKNSTVYTKVVKGQLPGLYYLVF